MRNVVIAGATGYLGRHLVKAFRDRGVDVRAIVRPGQQLPEATEVVHAQVTEAGSLDGVCEGADAVFSALGITRQTDRVTYEDVEYTANMQLMAEARRAGVKRFGVISVVQPQAFEGLAIMVSRERFIAELQRSELPSTVVRATGFFSDLKEVFDMAAKGRVWLLGDGTNKVNPIHGADLAEACIEAMERGEPEVCVGGPDAMSWNAIAELAFEALKKPVRVTHVPALIPKLLLPLVRPFSRRGYDVGSFLVRGATRNVLAPEHGLNSLRGFYEDLARAP